MEGAAPKIVDKHRQTDTSPSNEPSAQREAKKLARMKEESRQLRAGLEKNKEDRKGAIRLSNGVTKKCMQPVPCLAQKWVFLHRRYCFSIC